jgi:hypothetical protein
MIMCVLWLLSWLEYFSIVDEDEELEHLYPPYPALSVAYGWRSWYIETTTQHDD